VSIRGTVKFYVKEGKKGTWEQAIIYVRAEDRGKLEKYRDKEITLYLEPGTSTVEPTVDKRLLDLLVKLFTKAFTDKKIANRLIEFEETEEILKILEGEG